MASAESVSEEEDYEIIEQVPVCTKVTSEKIEVQEESLDDILLDFENIPAAPEVDETEEFTQVLKINAKNLNIEIESDKIFGKKESLQKSSHRNKRKTYLTPDKDSWPTSFPY